jgi:hypothetical protein
MIEKPTIEECFSLLSNRMFEIKKTIKRTSQSDRVKIIEHIKNSGFLSINYEDAYHGLNIYKGLLTELSDKLLPIIETLPIQPPFFTIEEERKELLREYKEELNFYVESLNAYSLHLEELIDAKGSDRFSNAGWRLNLLLTVPEIGSLFGALWDAKIIDQSLPNGQRLTKNQLASFIFKNFTHINKKDGTNFETISEGSVKGHFASSNSEIEPIIEEFLKDLGLNGRETIQKKLK